MHRKQSPHAQNNTNGQRDVTREADKLSHKGRERRKGGLSRDLTVEPSLEAEDGIIGRQRAEGQSMQSEQHVQKARRCETTRRGQGLQEIYNN